MEFFLGVVLYLHSYYSIEDTQQIFFEGRASNSFLEVRYQVGQLYKPQFNGTEQRSSFIACYKSPSYSSFRLLGCYQYTEAQGPNYHKQGDSPELRVRYDWNKYLRLEAFHTFEYTQDDIIITGLEVSQFFKSKLTLRQSWFYDRNNQTSSDKFIVSIGATF